MSGRYDAITFPETAAQVVTLGNGLEIIVKEDHSAPVVSLQAWCRSGSIHEGEWLGAGMSHYLEHMLFKGSEKRGAAEIAQAVQEEGGYINAYTSFDRTVYWIDAPASGMKNCLEVLCDVVGRATLPSDEFDSEREVIRREIAMGEDNPDQVISKLLFRTAYTAHPCRFPVIGHLDLFNQLSRDDLYDYYRRQYSPDNLFFVVVGAVDRDEVVDLISQEIGDLERKPRAPVNLPVEAPIHGIRDESVSFPTELYRGRLSWPIPEVSDKRIPAIDVMADILGDGRSSRLFREIREKKQLAHSVGSYAYTPSFPGQLVFSFDTESDKAEAAEVAILEELENLRTGGVLEQELKRSKRQALSSQLSTLTDMRGQASDIGSNWILTRNLETTADYVKAIEALEASDIAEVAEEFLTLQGGYSRVALVPEQKAVPKAGRSSPGRSESIRRVTIESGLTVLLLEDRRVPFVHANAAFRGGVLAEDHSSCGLTRLMARLLTKDTRQRSADALADAIESVGGGIAASIGNNTFGLGTYALRPDLNLAIDLLGETLLEPAFLSEVVDREKQFQIAQIKAEADRPFSVAMKELRRGLFGDHPYGLEASGTEESVAAMDQSEIVAIHQKLVRGGNGVLAVVGDLDLDEAEAQVRSRFESLPSGDRVFTQSRASEMPSLEGSHSELTHDKEQAVLLIGFRTVPIEHPDNPALELIDEACSDMASRLFIRIREELGLAYSVGTTRLLGFDPGAIIFYVSTSPEKLDLVEAEMLDEIGLLTKSGLDLEEFKRAQASWLGREVIQLQGARELAGRAVVDELVGLGWDNYQSTPDLVRGLQPAAVHEIAAKYLTEGNRFTVRLTTS
ncbi:MAG: pitrilysin family protein [Verrucomicrobiota bacterium]